MNNEICNGHGDCVEDNITKGKAKCLCHSGWVGGSCAEHQLLSEDPIVYYLVGGVVAVLVLVTIVLTVLIILRKKSDNVYTPVLPIEDAEDPVEEEPYY